MNTSIVITNLRIPKNQYRKAKILASEKGMSFNQYINQLLQEEATLKQLGLYKKYGQMKKRPFESLWKLPKLAKLPSKPMGASENDKAIYGIED